MKTLKITAAMTAFIFLIQTVGFSAPELIQMSLSSKEVSPAQLDIQIPRELGEIQKINLSSEGTGVMVHIQDAHGNYGAQKNIQGILRHLHEKYGMRLLLLEGADAKLDSSLFHFFKESRLNEKVADILMKHGEFTGPEMFLLTENENQVEGHGIEETGLYRRDVELFRQVIRGRESSRTFFDSSEGRIQVLESRIFTKDLRDFVKEWKKEQSEERANLLNYIQVLAQEAAIRLSLDLKNPVNQDAYPAILRVLMLKDLEAQLDVKQIDKEKTALLKDIKGKVSESLYQALDGMEASKQANPRFALEKIHEQVKGLDYKNYPAFSKYAAYLIFQAEIQSEELFKESAALTERIFEVLAKTEQEKQLLTLVKDAILLEKLFKLELSRHEYGKIASHQESFEPENFISRVAVLENDKKAGAVSGLPETKALFANGLEFYRLAQERELHFIEKAVRRMKEKNETRAMAVTGGFHTEGFEELVKSKGLSYVLVSPRIHDVKNTHEIYMNAMLGKTKISAVTLKEEIKQSAVDQAAKSQVMVATHLEPEDQQAALWGGEEVAVRSRVTRQVVEEVRMAASLGEEKKPEPAVTSPASVEMPMAEAQSLGMSKNLIIAITIPLLWAGANFVHAQKPEGQEVAPEIIREIVPIENVNDLWRDILWQIRMENFLRQYQVKPEDFVPGPRFFEPIVSYDFSSEPGPEQGQEPKMAAVLPPPASAYLAVVEFLAGQLGPIARDLDERQSKAALENALKLYFQGYTRYSLSRFITDMQVDLFPTVVPGASLNTIGEAITMESQKNADYAEALKEYAFRQTSPGPHVYQEPSLEARLAQFLKQLQMPSFLEVLGQSLGEKPAQPLNPKIVDHVFSEIADGRDISEKEPQTPKVQASAPGKQIARSGLWRFVSVASVVSMLAGWLGIGAAAQRRVSSNPASPYRRLGIEVLADSSDPSTDNRTMLSGVTGLFSEGLLVGSPIAGVPANAHQAIVAPENDVVIYSMTRTSTVNTGIWHYTEHGGRSGGASTYSYEVLGYRNLKTGATVEFPGRPLTDVTFTATEISIAGAVPLRLNRATGAVLAPEAIASPQTVTSPNGRFRVISENGTLTVSRLRTDGTVDPEPRYTQTIQVDAEGVSLVKIHVTNDNLFYVADDHGTPKIYTLYLSNVGTVTPNNPSLINLPEGITPRDADAIQFVANEMRAIVTDAEGFHYPLHLFFRSNLVTLGTEKDSPDGKHRVVQDINDPSLFYVINQETRDYSYNKADVSLLVVKTGQPERGFTITDSGFTIRVNGQDRTIDYSAISSETLARKDLTQIGLYDYYSAGTVSVNLETVKVDSNLDGLLEGTGVDPQSLNFPKNGDRNTGGGVFTKAIYFYTQSPDGKIAVAYTGEYQYYTTFSTTLRGGYVYTGSQLTSISPVGGIVYRRPGQDEIRYTAGPLLGIGFDSENRLLFSAAYGTSGVLDSLDAQGRIRIVTGVSFQLPIAGVDAKTGTAYHGYSGEKARNANFVIAGANDAVVYVAGLSPEQGRLNEVYLPLRYNPPQDAKELAVTSARFLNANVAEIVSQNGEKRYLILSAPQAGTYDQRVQVQVVEGAVTPDGSKLVYAKDRFKAVILNLATGQTQEVDGDLSIDTDKFKPIASNQYAVVANGGAYIYAVSPLGTGAQSKAIYIEDEAGRRFQRGFEPVSGKFLMDKTVELTLKNGKFAVVHLPSGKLAVYDRPDGNPLDTNRDGVVAPNDVLRGINLMNRVGGAISADHPEYDPLLDTSRDGHFSAIDLLRIINELNGRRVTEAEGDLVEVRLPQAEGEAPVVEVVYSSGDKDIFDGSTLQFQQLQRASIPAGHGPGSIRQIGSSYIVSVNGIQLTPFDETPQIETAVPAGWPSRSFDVTGLDPNVFNVRSPYGTHFETITNGETVTFVDSLARRFRIGAEESENTIPDFLSINGDIVPLTVTAAGSNPIGWRLFNVSFQVSGLRGDGTDQLEVLAIYGNKLLSTTHYVSGDAQTWALFGVTGARGAHSHVSIERPGTFNVYETGLAAEEPILSARYSRDNRFFVITTPTKIVTLDVQTGAKSTVSHRQGINLVTAETYKGQWLPYTGTGLDVNEAGNLAIAFPDHANGSVSNPMQPDISYADAGQIYVKFRGQAPGHFQVLVTSGINLHFREEVDVTGTGWQELRINVPSFSGQAGAVTLRTYHYDVALNLEISDFTFVPRSIVSPLDPQVSPNGQFQVSFDSLSGSLIAENLVTHTTQTVVVASRSDNPIGRAHLVGFRPTNAGVYYHGDQRGNLYFEFLAFANFDAAHKAAVILPADPPVQRYGSSVQFVPGTQEPLIWAQLYNLQRELIRLPVNPATGNAVVVAHPVVNLAETLTNIKPDSTIIVPANAPYVSALTQTVGGDEMVVRSVNGQRILQVKPAGGQTKYFRLDRVADRYEIALNRGAAGYNLIYPGSVGSVVYVYDSRNNKLYSMDVSPVTFSSLEGARAVDAGSVVLSTTYNTSNTFTITQGDGDQYRFTVSVSQPPVSPNNRFQVSFDSLSGSLTAENLATHTTQTVAVVSRSDNPLGRAHLSGFTVTNKGVYYAGDQRGNPFIKFIPFKNFSAQAITDVRLPRGIYLAPGVNVQIVQGLHGIADIRGNDFISRRVNLEKRTVGNLGFKLIGLGEIPTRNQAGVIHQNYDTSLIQRDPLHKNVGLGIVLRQPLNASITGLKFHLDVLDDRFGTAVVNRMKVRVVDDAGHARTFNLRGLIDSKGNVRIPARLLWSPWGRGAFRIAKLDILIPEGRDIFKGILDFSGLSAQSLGEGKPEKEVLAYSQIFNRALPDSILNVAHDVTLDVYNLEGTTAVVVNYYRERLGLIQEPDAEQILSEAIQAANEGGLKAQDVLAYLGVIPPATRKPVILFINEIFGGEDKKLTPEQVASMAKKIAGGMNEGDLLVGVVAAAQNRLMAKLYEEAGKGQFRAKAIPQALLSDSALESLTAKMDTAPVTLSSLTDAGDAGLKTNSMTRIRLNKDALKNAGMNLDWAVGLLEQIADNPEALRKLGLRQDSEGFWEAGSGFVALIEKVYAELKAQNKLAVAA